jgi:hypothetical protein
LEKDRENAAALVVLHDLLAELDSMESQEERLQALVQGALAANIFDWCAFLRLCPLAVQAWLAHAGEISGLRDTRAKYEVSTV